MSTRSLNFELLGSEWIARETVQNDYSLHLEREAPGLFGIRQRSSSTGRYSPCILPSSLARCGEVIDHSFGHGVYPMQIEIVSTSKVTMGEIREAES